MQNTKQAKLLALGASTGGPEALKFILSHLPKQFPIPIVIVQHISKGFLNGLIDWLQVGCSLTIKVANNNERLEPGFVYFAPDDYHLAITNQEDSLITKLVDSDPLFHFKPSINYLFHSLVKNNVTQVIAGLLTGMGKDGGDELLALKKKGAFTFVQNEQTSIVFGMPAYALSIDAANIEVALQRIPEILAKMLNIDGENHD